MLRKICFFCSNPVNGGTAEIFAECIKELADRNLSMEIIPCVNDKNDVKVYDTLQNIERLCVYSQAQVLGEIELEKSILRRAGRKILRNIKYVDQKKRNIKVMQKFLIDHKVDTVIIHNGGYIGDDLCNQMLQAAWKIKVKNRIMIFHNDFYKNAIWKLMCIGYDMTINRFATQTVTVSEFTKNRILSGSFLKKDMKVIHNGITFQNTICDEQKKRDIAYKNTDIHLGMVGNFLSNKGQIQLLKAIKKVVEKTPKRLQVFLIGNVYDKEYYQKCKEYIVRYELDNIITICHQIYNAKEYMNLFDVTIIPSTSDESFGVIGVESMRNGVPVVAFRCGGIPEVIEDGVSGYVVEVGDAEAMADAILKLIENLELRLKMKKRAQKEYELKFTRKIMGDSYLELINQ